MYLSSHKFHPAEVCRRAAGAICQAFQANWQPPLTTSLNCKPALNGFCASASQFEVCGTIVWKAAPCFLDCARCAFHIYESAKYRVTDIQHIQPVLAPWISLCTICSIHLTPSFYASVHPFLLLPQQKTGCDLDLTCAGHHIPPRAIAGLLRSVIRLINSPFPGSWGCRFCTYN